MSQSILIILGILIAATSLITIPSAWKTPVFFTLGALVALIEYRRHYQSKRKPLAQRRTRAAPQSSITGIKLKVETPSQTHDQEPRVQ